MKAEKLTSSESTKLQTSAVPNNVITYTAKEKLEETSKTFDDGLHINAFHVKIESHTFNDGTGTITFEGEVTTIGDEAFKNCSGLTSIVIPDSVTKIGWSAFNGCSGLTSITIPDSVTEINSGTFADCTSLTKIELPNGLQEIRSLYWDGREARLGAFNGCTSLKKLVLPNKINKIDYGTFAGCNNLALVIPDGIESLEGETLSHIEYDGLKFDCQSAEFSIKREYIEGVLCARLNVRIDNEEQMYIPSFVKIMNMNLEGEGDRWRSKVLFYDGHGTKYFIPNSVSKIIYRNTDRDESSQHDYQSSKFYIDNYMENVDIVGADKRRDRHFFFRAPQPNTKVDGRTLELTLASNNFYFRSNGLWSAPITIHSEFVAYITPVNMECFGEPEHEGCRILLLGRGGECHQCEQGFPSIDVWESYETVLSMLHKAEWHKR